MVHCYHFLELIGRAYLWLLPFLVFFTWAVAENILLQSGSHLLDQEIFVGIKIEVNPMNCLVDLDTFTVDFGSSLYYGLSSPFTIPTIFVFHYFVLFL